MEQLIKELEELLAERRKVKNIISSTQEYTIQSTAGSVSLQSASSQLSGALGKFKVYINNGMSEYLAFLNEKIKDKIKEIL